MSRRHVVAPLSALSLALALAGLTAPAVAAPPLTAPRAASPGPSTLGRAVAQPAALPAAADPTSRADAATDPQRVRILGGDVVSVVRTPTGRAAPRVSSISGSAVTVITTPTTTFAFPLALTTVLGVRLDPSLFDVFALTSAGPSGLPVTVTYTSTSAPTAVPGVEILSRSGLIATGRVTPSSSAALGVALRTASATTLFGSVAKITAASSGGVQPQFPMFTLTVNATAANGKAMNNGIVAVVNMEEMARYVGIAFVSRGVAKVSVPAGTYALVATAPDPVTPNRVQLAVRTDVPVAGATSATVDARTATVPVRLSTPRPATLGALAYSATLTDAAQLDTFGATVFGFGDIDLRVSPVAPPRVGSLDWSALAHLDSPTGAAPYTYDVARIGTGGIPGSLTFLTRAADLTAVKASYSSPAPALGMPGRAFIGSYGGGGFAMSVPVPLERTEYVAAPPGTVVADDYFAEIDPDTFSFYGYLSAGPWTPQPGTRRAQTWNKAPLTPRLSEVASVFGPTLCPACVVGDELTVVAHPFSDAEPTHIGAPDPINDSPRAVASWKVAFDGSVVGSGDGQLAATMGGASTASAVSIDYTTDGRVSGAKTPSHTVTHWDIPLAAATKPAPFDWQCAAQMGADPAGCRVLPLMTVRYQIPTDLSGRLAAGTTRARLLVSHVNAAQPITVSTPAMFVSFDGGGTWQRTGVISEGSGNFTVTFTTPPASPTTKPARFKVSISDAVGGHFTELVTAAFTVR